MCLQREQQYVSGDLKNYPYYGGRVILAFKGETF